MAHRKGDRTVVQASDAASQVDQGPRSTNRRTTNAVTFARLPYVAGFGVPSASAIRSATAPPEIGGVGIAARVASAFRASPAARDHRHQVGVPLAVTPPVQLLVHLYVQPSSPLPVQSLSW